MNIERGLLWNQENAINRGIQINQTMGKFAASLSWNDGYYSNRYSWLSGSLTYTQGPHALTFVGMGNAGHTAYQTAATPVQNNSVMYELGYTYPRATGSSNRITNTLMCQRILQSGSPRELQRNREPCF